MTTELGPFCAHCGRPTRFAMNGQYQCKQGCDQAAREAEAVAAAQSQLNAAQAAVADAGRRITMPAPEPPTLTGPIERVTTLLEEHPELEESIEAPVVETESEPEPAAASAPKPRQRRRRR